MNIQNIANKQIWETFKKLWFNVLYKKQSEIIDDIEKYIWSQMNMFFSAAQTIENIPCYDPSGKLIKSEDLDSSLIFRQISGGTLRLLLESYFRTMYLYSAGPEKEKDRLEDIISSFGFAYNRFIREANKRKDKYDFLLKKLPPKITTIKTKNIDIRRLLQNSVDIEGNTLEHLYTIYSIACLYAHGTIDNFIWDKLFDETHRPNSPALNAFNFIYFLSLRYIILAKKLWGNKYKEEFDICLDYKK